MKPLPVRDDTTLRLLDRARGWAPPRAVGGYDNSHHRRTLARLHRLGLAERKDLGLGDKRPQWHYRLADAGRAYLDAYPTLPQTERRIPRNQHG